MSYENLDLVCECGHTKGAHKAVPHGQPARCKADGDTCPCPEFTPLSLQDATRRFSIAVERDAREGTVESWEAQQRARADYIAALNARDARGVVRRVRSRQRFPDTNAEVIARIESGKAMVTRAPATLPPEQWHWRRIIGVSVFAAGLTTLLGLLGGFIFNWLSR
jgi:hypothetical protein